MDIMEAVILRIGHVLWTVLFTQPSTGNKWTEFKKNLNITFTYLLLWQKKYRTVVVFLVCKLLSRLINAQKHILKLGAALSQIGPR